MPRAPSHYISLSVFFFCFSYFSVLLMAENEQEKSQLATEICDISSRAIACAKFHHSHTRKKPFINWYLVLRVNENADIYVIRKQFHKLALQLHPDKNKHSMAETAFKLVSEAYFCLSDSAKRAAFDSQRQTISCAKCNNTTDPSNITKIQKTHHQETTTARSNRIQKQMKELRSKLKDEANIIEKCLIANATASRRQIVKNGNGTKWELPVFNPSDYSQYNGSPQNRTTHHRQMEDLRACFRMGNRCLSDRVSINSSPVFQCRSERVSINSSPVFQCRSERVSMNSYSSPVFQCQSKRESMSSYSSPVFQRRSERELMNSSPVFQCRSDRESMSRSPVFQYRSK